MKKRSRWIWLLMGSLGVAGVALAAEVFSFEAQLSGAQQSPTVMTDASGLATAEFASDFSSVDVTLNVDDIPSVVRAAHFHCARPGGNGPVVFGLFSPGPCDFDGERTECTLTNADYSGADCVPTTGRPINNIASLAFAMRDGLIYANVHSEEHPMGEVRGQMHAPLPEEPPPFPPGPPGGTPPGLRKKRGR